MEAMGLAVVGLGLLVHSIAVWRALDNLHERCLSLGRSVDLHTALLKALVGQNWKQVSALLDEMKVTP